MTLLHYIDNEPPWDGDYGEWDSRTQAGGSTIIRDVAAAFPERGRFGLHLNVVSGANAYLQKALGATYSSLWFGLWIQIPQEPTWADQDYIDLLRLRNVTNNTNSLLVLLRRIGGWPSSRSSSTATAAMPP